MRDDGQLCQETVSGAWRDPVEKGQNRRAVLMRPDDPLTAKEFVTAKDLSGLPIIMTKRSNVENELRNWFGDYFASLNILFHSKHINQRTKKIPTILHNRDSHCIINMIFY